MIITVILTLIISSLIVSADLTDGNVFYFSMDDTNRSGSTLIDLAGVNNATITDTGFGTPGIFNERVDFNDSSSSQIDVGDSGSTDITGGISICAWTRFNETDFTPGRVIVAKSHSDCVEPYVSYALAIEDVDKAMLRVDTGSRNQGYSAESSIPGDNTWVHICGVYYEGKNITLYVNGSVSGTPVSDSGSIDPNNEGVTIGYNPICGVTEYTFGEYDEVGLWNRSLSPAEVTELFELTNNPYYVAPAGGGGGSNNVTLYVPNNNTWVSNVTPTFEFKVLSNESSDLNCTLVYGGSTYWSGNATNNTYESKTPSALPTGTNTYHINCSDGAKQITSDTWTLNIDIQAPRITDLRIDPDPVYTLNDSKANLTVSEDLGSIYANLSCYVNLSLILTNNSNTLSNNTAFIFNQMNMSSYNKNDNISCNVSVWDDAGNTNTSDTYIIVTNIIPTTPNDINFSSSSFYYDYLTSFDGNGSSDADNDSITYYFQIYNINDSVLRQAFSSQNNYTPLLGDIGDKLRVTVIAVTDDANSTSYNESLVVYLTRANVTIIREKTNEAFNVSGADEMTMSFICEDDVQTVNVTSNNFEMNITCAYEFIKTDATYDNDSYFRIINPAYESFANITVYMLDLRYDTGVEIILVINDLTGEYNEGSVLIERYINGSLATIISQTIDIENSATLYLLKDALYTVKVENNLNETRVIGNLIASTAGTKTITLPEINFLPNDARLGDEVSWNYSYDETSYIQLLFSDALGETNNVTFTIWDSYNGSIVFAGFTTNSTNVAFIYYLNNTNATYLSNLTIDHSELGVVFEQKIFYPGITIVTAEEEGLFDNIGVWLFWISTITVFVIGLSFSARTSKIGLVMVLFFVFMFINFGWLDYGGGTGVIFGLMALLVILNFISKSQEVKE